MNSQAGVGLDSLPGPPSALRSQVALLLLRCRLPRTGSFIGITPLRKLIEQLIGGCSYRLCQIILNMEDMTA
jgi:hypothetical protein